MNDQLSCVDIGEMMGIAIIAKEAGFKKIQGDPDHIIQLCQLALNPPFVFTPDATKRAIAKIRKLQEEAKSQDLMALVLEYSEILKLLGEDDGAGVFARKSASDGG